MFTRTSIFGLLVVLGALAGANAAPAQAQGWLPYRQQKSDLPDASQFYMARQRWQVINTGPVVNNMYVDPAVQQQGAPLQAPPMAPAALPPCGNRSYLREIPGLAPPDLPKVNTNVPGKVPHVGSQQPVGQGQRSKSAKLPKPQQPKPDPYQGVRAYDPYKEYKPAESTSGASQNGAHTNVKGDVLHWARARRQQPSF